MVHTLTGIFTADQLHGQGQYFNPCQLRPFDIGCPKPLTPHHCVPDHCFVAEPEKKSGGKVTRVEKRIEIEYTPPPPLPPPSSPPPAKTKMTNKEGLCICVDGTVKADGPCDDGNFQYSQENGMARLWSGKTDTDTNDAKKKYLLNKIAYKKAEKTNSLTDDIKKDLLKASAALEKRFTELYDAHTPNKNREKVLQGQHGHKNKEWKTTTPQRNRRTYYNALGTHGKIHHIFDAAEDELARLNAEAPPGPNLGENVATLDQLENLAADVLSKVTGCDSNDLKSQIREYHKEKGIHEDTLLRANAKGGQKADLKDNRTLGEKLDPKPGGLPTIPTDYTQKTTTEPNITPGKNMKDHLEHIYNYFELIPK